MNWIGKNADVDLTVISSISNDGLKAGKIGALSSIVTSLLLLLSAQGLLGLISTCARHVVKIRWVWLFFDDVHLMISKWGARLGRCVWSA